MEGVGARFGRSSNRYTPATVFTGPVRKWKKKWVQLTPSATTHQSRSPTNGTVNGANRSSRLLMYRWTPSTTSSEKDGNNSDNAEYGDSDKDDVVSAEEPPRKKIKFIPVAVLEKQNDESLEQNEYEAAKPIEIDVNTAETTSEQDEKPDINDIPKEETQVIESDPQERQDLNKSTLDLSLGLNAHDSGNESSKPETDRVNDADQQD